MKHDEKLIYYSKECLTVIKQMLRNLNLHYEPAVVERLMDYLQKHVTDMLNEAIYFMENDRRTSLNLSDVKIALDFFGNEHDNNNVNHKELVELSKNINEKHLPEITTVCGTPLPNNDYCLTKPNYKLKFLKEKFAQEHNKFPLFSPINFHLPNNLKNRITFSQSPYMPHSLFHMTNQPEPFQKHKIPQVALQPQKLTLKPKLCPRSNIENSNGNSEMRKEIIKRQVYPEPQKIIFKPKLLLSLNTNDVAKKEETSPLKRKKF